MPRTFVTTTTYGTWLPGDLRGYVDDGEILPPSPSLLRSAQARLASSPVLLTGSRQQELFDALVAGCEEFGYHLTDASVEAWHLHWIIEHDDKVSEMVGRLKNRMRQALAIGRIWTVGYWDRVLHDQASLLSTRHYIARHRGCRMTDGKFSVL